MAYIVVVNPQILSQAGLPIDGVVFATCISSAAATLVMGLYANYPIALAPGMSLNAYFTYVVCLQMHVPWRTALGVIFLSGVVFLILTVTRVREQIVNGIPDCLKHSTAGGIGMFIAFVGLRNANLVVANPATFVSLGNLRNHEAQLACVGLGIILILMTRKITGAILIGVVGSIVGALTGTSTVTSYIESAAGVAAGARTGLSNVVVAALFLAAAFFAPLAAAIPGYATAPALIVVGALMAESIGRVQWPEFTEAIPAFVTLLATPLTFSIATGLSLGLVSYTLVKVAAGKFREVSPVIWILTLLFIFRYIYLAAE